MEKLSVLLVPDSIHWVTGTIARSIARHNPWIQAAIISGEVLDVVLQRHPELLQRFELVHFLCSYSGKRWLSALRPSMACVTTHHHVTDWGAVKHNLDADAIMTDSTEWIEDLTRRGFPPARAVSVPSGVDTDLFRSLGAELRAGRRDALGIPRNSVAIGFFAKRSSNDDDRKGTEVMRQALDRLVGMAVDVTMVVVGPGWDELVESLRACGVRCVWIPFVKDSESLALIYPALDFYWVASRVEGGPVTLLEAMSCEVCCITTPVGIAREIAVDGVNSAVVPIGDPEPLARRTGELAADTETRRKLSRAGRRTVEERMSHATTMSRIRDLYEIALANFAQRTGKAPRRLPPNAAAVPGLHPPEPPLLPLIPPAITQEIRMRENVAWGEHLAIYHDERRAALGILLAAWAANPLSLLPPRALLRRFLPPALVACVVSLKGMIGRRRDGMPR